MKTTVKTASATTEKGTVLNLTVTAKRGWEEVAEHLYNDGDESDVKVMKEINETTIVLEANGQEFTGSFTTGMFVPDEYKSKGVYAIFAEKIGLSERVYNELNAAREEAIAEAETDENWIAYQAKKAQAMKDGEEYERHCKDIENAMTLNGRTY